MNERESDNIRQAILRYDIQHPVVNDYEFRIWQHYTVRAWPTLIVIKPDGYVLGYLSGEGNRETLEQVIDELIAEARRAGMLNETPITFALEKDKTIGGMLSFPGKVYAHELSQRLFIADSNHNRIVISDLAGQVLDVAGSGAAGKADGTFATATFHHPQGMSFDGKTLYVADTENHILRQLDLDARTVTTIAGTGAQARAVNVLGTGTGVALNSPWDLQVIGTQLFIAMAGPHQIWVMQVDKIEVQPLQVRAGQAGQLGVYIELPEGYHLNPRAPFAYRVDVTGNGITVAEAHRRFRAIAPPLPLRIPFEATPGEHQAMLDVDLTFSFCREDDTGVCAIQSVRWNVPLQTVDKEVKTEPSISYQAASPKVNKQL
jgi:hypothetical protein